jgi:hypothetical protein
MRLADLVRHLRTAGLTNGQVIKALIALDEERLAKGRARTARWRDKPANVTSQTSQTSPASQAANSLIFHDISNVTPIAPSRARATHLKSLNNNIKKERERESEPVRELREVLDPVRTAAVIEHRQRLRAPLTAYAAKQLAESFRHAADPNKAADTMIARGWRGYDATWGQPDKAANSHSVPDGFRYETAEEFFTRVGYTGPR